MSSVLGQDEGIVHGTLRGYRQHTYRGVAKCDPCRQAHAAETKLRRAMKPRPSRAKTAATVTRASEPSTSWNGGGRFPTAPKTAAPTPGPPVLPEIGNPAWGIPVWGADLAEGDVIVHLGQHHIVDHFQPYTGSLLAELGAGTRTACSGAWEMTIGEVAVIRILARAESAL